MTPRAILEVVRHLARQIPDRFRGWLYLGLAVAGVAYVAVTRDNFGGGDLLALLAVLSGGTAKANTPKKDSGWGCGGGCR